MNPQLFFNFIEAVKRDGLTYAQWKKLFLLIRYTKPRKEIKRHETKGNKRGN